MQTYSARDIYNLNKESLWALPNEDHTLIFDDGNQYTVGVKATIYSWYTAVFHRRYPDTPVLPHHHLGDRQIGKGTELELMGAGLFDCLRLYGDQVDPEELSLIAFQAQNELTNDMTTRLKSFVSTISILDFVDAVEHPEIKQANEEVKPTQHSIDQTYDKIWEVLTREGELKNNTVARMSKSGLVSRGQVLQCVGPRGFTTDIDSTIQPRPILTGYVRGLHSLYDSMTESRSASKALMFAKDPVAESEYFNREMQLAGSVLPRLHRNDCGSKNYIYFKVRSSMDLELLAGKYYVAEGGQLKELTQHDRHLYGKLIQLRSVLKCAHPDPYGVCSTCFGTLSYSVPRDTNLGHVSVTVMCEKISQNVLSTKHLDGSSKVDEFDISQYDRQFIRTGSDMAVRQGNKGGDSEQSTVIKLAEGLSGRKVLLTIAERQAEDLSELDYQDVDTLAPSNISKLTEVRLTVENVDGEFETHTVPVSMGSRQSWLSSEALAYIQKTGFSLSTVSANQGRSAPNQGSYVIDLSDWDANLPLFQLPLKHTDMVEYMKTIKSFVMAAGETGKSKTQKTLKDFPTVDLGLVEFYNLINSKLKVNIAHLEVIVLASMVRDIKGGDHRLPRPIQEGELSSYGQNMEMRSMGVSMAYERQSKLLTNVRSFIHRKRPDSPFDNLLLPFETVNPRE